MLTVKCAWHHEYFGSELVMGVKPGGDGVTHGICYACKELFVAELDKKHGERLNKVLEG